ncbi:MAG TPA: hypothetical protein VIG06_27630 [Kofleriaceae bacterium]
MCCARRRRNVLAALAVVAAAVAARPAGAYEFEIRARTYGQAEELRSIRFVGGSLLLASRRFTQTLALSIWDIGRPSRIWRLYDTTPEKRGGPRISFQTYLRLDHDFGEWVTGDIDLGSRTLNAVDVIPELENQSLQLDILYGYLSVEDLLDGALDLHLGRQVGTDALDWYAMDGLTARVESRRLGIAGEAFGGLLVRESSPLGTGTFEPDGTSGAECQEYAEGAAPGTGVWQPIDLGFRTDTNPFRSDVEVCPQREELMPTFGGAVELVGLRRLNARLSYRRAMSPTTGLIGAPDRLDEPDLGLYPDENGQAPGWGVNQERVALSARAPWDFARGRGQIEAHAAARYSLLHSLIDEAYGGGRLRWNADSFEPELAWTFPTFDGDSIFNVFSIQPYVEGRLTWEHAAKSAPWATYARGWLRRFRIEDSGRAAPGADVSTGALAGGGQAGGQWRAARDRSLRLDLLHEGGYGGRRSGGNAYGRWRVHPRWIVSSRLSFFDYASDIRDQLDGWTLGVQAGGTHVLQDEIAITLIAEETTSPAHDLGVALFALVDLAFRPEI